MSDAIAPTQRQFGLARAWLLVLYSLLSTLVMAVLFPNLFPAGGVLMTPVGFAAVIACAAIGVGAFLNCPRYHLVPKGSTFLLLWPLLGMATKVVVQMVGWWLIFHS